MTPTVIAAFALMQHLILNNAGVQCAGQQQVCAILDENNWRTFDQKLQTAQPEQCQKRCPPERGKECSEDEELKPCCYVSYVGGIWVTDCTYHADCQSLAESNGCSVNSREQVVCFCKYYADCQSLLVRNSPATAATPPPLIPGQRRQQECAQIVDATEQALNFEVRNSRRTCQSQRSRAKQCCVVTVKRASPQAPLLYSAGCNQGSHCSQLTRTNKYYCFDLGHSGAASVQCICESGSDCDSRAIEAFRNPTLKCLINAPDKTNEFIVEQCPSAQTGCCQFTTVVDQLLGTAEIRAQCVDSLNCASLEMDPLAPAHCQQQPMESEDGEVQLLKPALCICRFDDTINCIASRMQQTTGQSIAITVTSGSSALTTKAALKCGQITTGSEKVFLDTVRNHARHCRVRQARCCVASKTFVGKNGVATLQLTAACSSDVDQCTDLRYQNDWCKIEVGPDGTTQ